MVSAANQFLTTFRTAKFFPYCLNYRAVSYTHLDVYKRQLLSIARQSAEPLTLTKLGELLGCSRQNVKKLALALQEKGFAKLRRSDEDARALTLLVTGEAEKYFTGEFARYAGELGALFSVYTEEEIAELFGLMMRLYEGLDRLDAVGEDEK